MAEHPPPQANAVQNSSREWLKVRGLQALQLTMDQILPTLGFKQRRGEVPGLHHTVPTQYAEEGLFTQHPNSSGQVYNLCSASVEKLQLVEERLLEAVAQLKARLEWLNSGSRLSFGVVTGRHVVMVVDSNASDPTVLGPLLEVSSDAIAEQFSSLEQFNIIRCTNGVECWRESLVDVSEGCISDAVQWVRATPVQTTALKTSVVEALTQALAHSQVDEVYLLTQGESSLQAYDQLLQKASTSLVPLHVVAIDCLSTDSLAQYQRLASAASGRCHAYSSPSSTLRKHPLLSSTPSLSSSTPSPPSAKRPSSGLIMPASHLPREDVLLVWKELEKARDTLAEVQALQLEMQRTAGEGHGDHDSGGECLTSVQWLESHGVRARKLMFEDLVSSLAFRHCNGTIRLPEHTRKNATIEMIPHSKVVHAQYCKDFVHLRWRDGKVVHVQLSERDCEVYRGRVEGVVRECRERLAWLKSGSRELFGTILEDKVVLVIDTSSSMGQRLELVKQKIHQLIQEQLCQKQAFTLVRFSSGVQPWRENLVPTSDQNLAAVWQWVQALQASGSTNTLDALSRATAVRGAKAVYLLTDGRPDQPPAEVLARVQEMPKIPIHTISFNCGDSNSNRFLAQLASTTGGRYYYYSEDVSDPNGPKSYQGEDIQCLEAEMTLASEQLHRTQELRRECEKAQWRGVGGKGTGRGSHKSSGSVHSSSRGNPRSTFTSSKKWLQKHSLASLHLTLMDALGPSAIPHSPTYVPLLDRHVSSRVLPSLFSLAHISPTGQKVTLINPTGPDVRQYQQQLEKQVDKYWQRLTQLAWAAVPVEQRGALEEKCGVGEGEVPPYQQHRAVLRKVMEKLGWPRPQVDFDLLEQEIAQAETYKRYSAALMEESRRAQLDSPCSSEGDEENSMTSGESSMAALMDQLQLHTVTPSPPPPVKTGGRGGEKGGRVVREGAFIGKLKGQKVIARSSGDGFYYPGLVIDYADRSHTIVQFADGQQQRTPPRHVLAMGGAGPCPALRLSDRVLVRVRMKRGGAHPSSSGSCDYYIPAEVRVLPADPRKGHALYSVVAFNGRSVTSARKGIVKISEARYTVTCKYIRSKLANSPAEEKRTPTSIDLSRSPTHSTATTTDVSNLSPELTNGHQSLPASPLQSVMERQRTHEERLDEQLSAITTLQEQQMKMQAQLAESNTGRTQDEGEMQDEGETQDEGDGVGETTEIQTEDGEPAATPNRESDVKTDQPPSLTAADHLVTPSATRDGWVVGYLSQLPPDLAATCDQGVNTEPWMEERGMCTDPLMESRCVGTEWSDLSSDSSDDASPPLTPLARSPPSSVFVDGEPTPVLPSSPPPDLLTGQVLVRWPDDGWYYRGEVVCCAGGQWYEVRDFSGDVLTLHISDIITDSQDDQLTISLDDTVLGLHPDYDSSYAPGQVVGVAVDGQNYTVEFYDEIQAPLHRNNLYCLPPDKHKSDVQYLRQKEQDWVGQAVITRRDTDGLYYPGRVLKQLLPTRHYLIQWTDGSTQEQEVVHMFGPPTRRHPMRIGDHVLALADKKHGVCMPAEVCGRKSDKLLVEFCDGKKDLVYPLHCFWISKFHYHNAVDYLCSTVTPSQSETPSEVGTS